MKLHKLSRTVKRAHVYLRKLVRFFGYSPTLLVYFPQNVSESCFDKTILDMRQKSRKGYIIQVIQWPKYIDGMKRNCFYCRKQSESQKSLKQQIPGCETILIFLLYSCFLFRQFYPSCLHSILNYSYI